MAASVTDYGNMHADQAHHAEDETAVVVLVTPDCAMNYARYHRPRRGKTSMNFFSASGVKSFPIWSLRRDDVLISLDNEILRLKNFAANPITREAYPSVSRAVDLALARPRVTAIGYGA
jgi:hypothetical protein